MVRVAALKALPGDGAVEVNTLAVLLRDDSQRVRDAAVEELGGSGDPAAVTMILDALQDGTIDEQSAVDALEQLPVSEVVSYEQLVLSLEDPALAVAAIVCMGGLGDARAVADVVGFARGDGGPGPAAVMRALAMLPGGLDALMVLFEEPELRLNVVRAVMGRSEPAAVGLLKGGFVDRDVNVRLAAFEGVMFGRDFLDQRIVTRDLDGLRPFLDPADEIERSWVRRAAARLQVSEHEVSERLEALRCDVGIDLRWRDGEYVIR